MAKLFFSIYAYKVKINLTLVNANIDFLPNSNIIPIFMITNYPSLLTINDEI